MTYRLVCHTKSRCRLFLEKISKLYNNWLNKHIERKGRDSDHDKYQSVHALNKHLSLLGQN